MACFALILLLGQAAEPTEVERLRLTASSAVIAGGVSMAAGVGAVLLGDRITSETVGLVGLGVGLGGFVAGLVGGLQARGGGEGGSQGLRALSWGLWSVASLVAIGQAVGGRSQSVEANFVLAGAAALSSAGMGLDAHNCIDDALGVDVALSPTSLRLTW